MYIYIYIHACVYTYMIYTYIYIYIHVDREREREIHTHACMHACIDACMHVQNCVLRMVGTCSGWTYTTPGIECGMAPLKKSLCRIPVFRVYEIYIYIYMGSSQMVLQDRVSLCITAVECLSRVRPCANLRLPTPHLV